MSGKDAAGLISAVGRGEWEDLLGALRVKTIVDVATASPQTTPTRRKDSPRARKGDKLIILTGMGKLADHVRSTGNPEACSMAKILLDNEQRRVRRKLGEQAKRKEEEDAPRAGFHGSGLDGRTSLIGERAGHRDE